MAPLEHRYDPAPPDDGVRGLCRRVVDTTGTARVCPRPAACRDLARCHCTPLGPAVWGLRMGPPRRCPRAGKCEDERFCRCFLPLVHIGQDEAAFKSNAQPKDIWIIGGVRGMRKKGDGIGLMASAFVDEVLFGFGIRLTAEQLALVNKYRAMLGKAALTESPGLRSIDYGINKEGYWQGLATRPLFSSA
jgi:hypothetical protein